MYTISKGCGLFEKSLQEFLICYDQISKINNVFFRTVLGCYPTHTPLSWLEEINSLMTTE